jgi:serine/threonine protein kinase
MEARHFASAEADPLRGVVVGGRFKIIWRIGIGGMGTVYRAEQVGLDRQVALKILKRELIADRETVRRFEREAKSTSLLVHPNTVRVFDYGETTDGLLFLAMELLEGELITQRLEGQRAMELHEAVVVAKQILQSLAEAHSKGIIHRDLKPDNIFLMRVDGRADPVVKVLDFGIAKVIQGERKVDQLETQAGTVFGTPRYMSPEQAQGKPLDARSDLYSVGVLLYQMLTGRALFLDDDAVVVMAKHIKERPVPMRKVAPQARIPQSLERVVMKALEKEPKDRFLNAEEFDNALTACLPDVEAAMRNPTSSRPVAAVTALSSVPRAALFASIAVLFVALVIAIYVLTSKPSHSRQQLIVTPVQSSDSAVDEQAPVVTSVLLRTEPLGAEVQRDGEVLGVTPLRVALGEGGTSVPVSLHLDGYDDANVELTSSNSTPLIALSPRIGVNSVSGSPAAATKRLATGARDAAVRASANRAAPQAAPSITTHVAPPDNATNMDTSMQTPASDPYERFE